MLFEQDGREIFTEINPEIALNRILSENFDLVVTDHEMPGMTGEELIKKVHSENPNLPFIMVSGNPPEEALDCLVFLKPVSIESLENAIKRLLNE